MKASREIQSVSAALCWFLVAVALRFGARTYPGVYIPEHPTLNYILNTGFLFTTIGYGAVAFGCAAQIGALLMALKTGTTQRLKIMALSLFAIAVLIAVYGLFWAMLLGRSS